MTLIAQYHRIISQADGTVLGTLPVIVCNQYWHPLDEVIYGTGFHYRQRIKKRWGLPWLLEIASYTIVDSWLLHLLLLLRGFWRIPAYFCGFMLQLMLLAIAIPYYRNSDISPSIDKLVIHIGVQLLFITGMSQETKTASSKHQCLTLFNTYCAISIACAIAVAEDFGRF